MFVRVCVRVCGGGGGGPQGKSMAKVRLKFSLIFRQAEFSPVFQMFYCSFVFRWSFLEFKTYEDSKREERKKIV